MISLSKYADMMIRSAKPRTSDFEISMSVPENYATCLSKFVNSIFETYEYDFTDNGLVKSIQLYNEQTNKTVKISLHKIASITDDHKIDVQEFVNDTLTFTSESVYTTYTEFKQSLSNLSNAYKTQKIS